MLKKIKSQNLKDGTFLYCIGASEFNYCKTN